MLHVEDLTEDSSEPEVTLTGYGPAVILEPEEESESIADSLDRINKRDERNSVARHYIEDRRYMASLGLE